MTSQQKLQKITDTQDIRTTSSSARAVEKANGFIPIGLIETTKNIA